MTELKQRELQLEEAHIKAESLFEDLVDTLNSVSLAVVVVDRDLKCEVINNSFYKLWKIDLNSFGPGSPFRALMDINRHNGVYDVKDADWENYVATRTAEIRKGNVEPRHFERADGVHMIYSVTNLSSERRLISYFDISEQKQREVQLQEANQRAESADRAKSEFLANMSHEIRTPMNGVMGMAELLAKTELSAKQKTFTDIIIKSGASLLTIINDILDFSKLDAGQMELDPAPFRLAEAIEDVATLVSSRVAEKDLELAVRIDPSLPEMFVGDVGRIRQIITNLMGNAVKFTESGHILVEVHGEVANAKRRGNCEPAVPRRGHRHRHPAGQGCPRFREIFTGRQLGHPQASGYRSRPCDYPLAGRSDGRRNRRRKRTRQRHDILVSHSNAGSR